MPRKAPTPWAVVDYSGPPRLKCLRCGADEPLRCPIPLNQLTDILAGFTKRHRKCKEPK